MVPVIIVGRVVLVGIAVFMGNVSMRNVTVDAIKVVHMENVTMDLVSYIQVVRVGITMGLSRVLVNGVIVVAVDILVGFSGVSMGVLMDYVPMVLVVRVGIGPIPVGGI
jgi:hypothetical protein